MPISNEKRLTGKYIEGDIWLPRQAIIGILSDDLTIIVKYGRNPEKISAVKEYTSQLIYRLTHMRI